ncbi:hypothetical protein E4U21_000174 [Claviceps maximensis]|nr:hypothetical protein E4U21_000174 [Claviceps maximensis]
MATKRLLSAPTTPSCPPSTSIPSSSETTLVGASSPVLHSQTQARPPRPEFFNQAEKLARMTLELKVHKLVGQINSLSSDLVQLKSKTKDNDVFCREHAGRMDKVCRETEAARTLAESCMLKLKEADQVKDKGADADTDSIDVKEYVRGQVMPVMDEVYGMKKLMEELMGMMGLVPTLAEADAVLAAVRVQREACEARGGFITGCTRSNDKRARIEETIRSTRRWHMDHKTTTLTDAEFIAKYLKKQSRRDPGMAVCLQRAIWKRVKARDSTQGGKSGFRRPQSLEEFCRHVVWEDVKRAVEDVFVRRVYGGAESLSQMEMGHEYGVREGE